MQPAKRVLVIGLDGATWDVLDPWIKDGTLPHLARLRRNGSWGPLISSIPPITAAAWSTFMTGKRPGKHGVYHFVKLFDDDGGARSGQELVSARSLRSPALWDVMGHHDRRVILINLPLTYPPRPVNGVMITGLLTPSSAPVFTYPPELSQEITDYQIDLDRFIDKTPHVDTFEPELTAPTLELMQEFRDMEEKRAKVTFSLMHSMPWDFFMVVFTATDRMGHYLWPYHHPPRDEDNPQARQLYEAVRSFYVRLDEIVGQLVAEAGEDVAVVIMSDHGMGPVETKRFHCNNWLLQQGLLAAKRSSASTLSVDAWLKRLGLPRDKLGRLIHHIPGLARSQVVKKAASSRSDSIDIERSKAYCVPIFFNIMGIRVRAEGAEKDALCDQMMRGLREIRDPETGRPVVQQVFRAAEYYDSAFAENTPDLIAITDPDYGCSYYLSHYSSLVTRRPDASGPAKHRSEGIFMAFGPGIITQPAPLPNLRIEDIAPTVLHLMGLAIPVDMDGRVLTEVLAPELRNVQTGEPMAFWPDRERAVFSDEAMPAEDEAELRGRLRALGYFE